MIAVEPEKYGKNSKEIKTIEEVIDDIPLKQQLFNIFREWASTSSAIGIPHIERASCLTIRITWIIFFLVSAGATGYFFIITLTAYMQFGVLNQITIAKQFPTFFPAVAICNLNPFNNNRSKDYIDDLLNLYNLTDFISILDVDVIEANLGTDNTIEILDNLLDDLRWWVATDKNLTDVEKRQLGFELNPDMLISCQFNGKKCTAADFSYFRSFKYGNCFVFNGGTTANGTKVDFLKTSKTGNDHGLEMELLVGDPKDEVRFVYKSGVYVTVFNQTLSTLQILDGGQFLPTGFDSFVSINREFYTKLPAPYSTCIDDYSAPPNDYAKKLYGYMSGMGVSVYTQEFCQSICYQDQLIDKCACADASLPTIRGAAFCISSRFQCMIDFQNTFNEADIDKQCNNGCPVKCNTVVYNHDLSQAVYPTSYYIDLLKTKADFTDNLDINAVGAIDFIDQSLVKVVINYEQLQYSQITEIPVTSPDALIGLLGGQLGAFIGITFLSLVEIIHLIMDMIRAIFLYYKTKKS